MFWYIFILCAILAMGGFSYYAKMKSLSLEKQIFFFCCALLLFFAALRSISVGADTKQYQWVFDWVKGLNFWQIPSAQGNMWYMEGQELFYKFYNKALSIFFQNNQAITVANSILLMVFVTTLVLRNSPNYWMSIFLFFTLGFYQTALNLTPSSIASYLCMIALHYAHAKKPVRYFIIVGIAALFHTSAISFFPVYLLYKIAITPKRFWSIIVLSAIICIGFFEYLAVVFTYFLPSKYLYYLESGSALREQLLVWASHILLFFFCWFVSCKTDKSSIKRNQAAFVFILLETVFYFLGLHIAIFSRVAFLFSPYLIISIPQLLTDRISLGAKAEETPISYIRCKTNSVRIGSLELARFIIVMAGIALYIARISINNIGTTMPYEFFWRG